MAQFTAQSTATLIRSNANIVWPDDCHPTGRMGFKSVINYFNWISRNKNLLLLKLRTFFPVARWADLFRELFKKFFN